MNQELFQDASYKLTCQRLCQAYCLGPLSGVYCQDLFAKSVAWAYQLGLSLKEALENHDF